MRRLCLFCIAVFAFIAPSAFSQEKQQAKQERNRGFYIEYELGLGGASYFGDTRYFIDSIKETSESHSVLDLTLVIGWAVTQNLYIVGSHIGVMDGFFDSSNNQSGVNITMYGIGTRYYPFKKYLQLGLDLGVSTMQKLYPNNMGSSTDSVGFGAKLFAGCDFDPSMTGFTGILGALLMVNFIENELILAYILSLKLAIK